MILAHDTPAGAPARGAAPARRQQAPHSRYEPSQTSRHSSRDATQGEGCRDDLLGSWPRTTERPTKAHPPSSDGQWQGDTVLVSPPLLRLCLLQQNGPSPLNLLLVNHPVHPGSASSRYTGRRYPTGRRRGPHPLSALPQPAGGCCRRSAPPLLHLRARAGRHTQRALLATWRRQCGCLSRRRWHQPDPELRRAGEPAAGGSILAVRRRLQQRRCARGPWRRDSQQQLRHHPSVCAGAAAERTGAGCRRRRQPELRVGVAGAGGGAERPGAPGPGPGPLCGHL